MHDTLGIIFISRLKIFQTFEEFLRRRWKAKINYIARFSQLMQKFAFFSLLVLTTSKQQQNFMHWKLSCIFQHLRDDLRKIKIQFSPEKKNIKVCRFLHEKKEEEREKSNKCTNLNPLCERRKSFLLMSTKMIKKIMISCPSKCGSIFVYLYHNFLAFISSEWKKGHSHFVDIKIIIYISLLWL